MLLNVEEQFVYSYFTAPLLLLKEKKKDDEVCSTKN
jgi:hypothetical protein